MNRAGSNGPDNRSDGTTPKWWGSKDPMGRDHYWFTVTPVGEADPGTDRWAFEHGWVSITPLRLDLTDHEALRHLAKAEYLQGRGPQ